MCIRDRGLVANLAAESDPLLFPLGQRDLADGTRKQEVPVRAETVGRYGSAGKAFRLHKE